VGADKDALDRYGLIDAYDASQAREGIDRYFRSQCDRTAHAGERLSEHVNGFEPQASRNLLPAKPGRIWAR